MRVRHSKPGQTDTVVAMNPESENALRSILAGQPIGALGTIRRRREGDEPEPFVSMVPVAWLSGSASALIHVSALSPHTADLLNSPRASLMLVAPRTAGDNPLALPRVTLQCDVQPLAPATEERATARAAYQARFESAAQTFELPDFTLFRLMPRAVRLIAGFGRAYAVSIIELQRSLG